MNEPIVPRAPDGSSPCHSRSPRWAILIVVAVALGSFITGITVEKRRHKQQTFDEGRRQFLEFLTLATDFGIVTINKQKLDGIICACSSNDESEGNDAVEAAKGVRP